MNNYPVNEMYIANKTREHYQIRTFWLSLAFISLLIIVLALSILLIYKDYSYTPITCDSPIIGKSSLTKEQYKTYVKSNIIMPQIDNVSVDKKHKR